MGLEPDLASVAAKDVGDGRIVRIGDRIDPDKAVSASSLPLSKVEECRLACWASKISAWHSAQRASPAKGLGSDSRGWSFR